MPPRRRSGSGEPFVWFTGMGLVLGLAMIAGLLGIIVYKGLEAFWPMRVAEATLNAAGQERMGRDTIVGHVLAHQRKTVLGPDGTRGMEYKFQVGNRDLFGNGFLYVDADLIESFSQPDGVIRMERMEYGPVIAWPVRIDIAGQESIAPEADPRAFRATLDRLVAEVTTRRREIDRIERRQIGDINAEMTSITRERRRLDRLGTPDAAALATLDRRDAELQERYEVLAIEARRLRAVQNENTFTYRISDDREKTIPFGEIVEVTEPNALTFAGRLGQFFHNMWVFVSDNPREANMEGGVFPALFGTLVMTVILSLAVTPFGVIAAIYLREYAKDGPVVRMVRIAINNLAGVPSIVFGVFGLGFFVYVLGGTIDSFFYPHHEAPVFGTGGIFWAALTLALMTVPVVIVATEESLAAVSRGVREGSLACGASKWQTIARIVLPASAPGIITGMILAMARGAGEVAPLMLVGVVKLAPSLPLDTEAPFLHLDRKFMHLGFHIFDLGFQSPDSEAARPMVFATTLLLIVMVVLMNMTAIIIRERLRRKYATGAF